jgi:hypothetical protein
MSALVQDLVYAAAILPCAKNANRRWATMRSPCNVVSGSQCRKYRVDNGQVQRRIGIQAQHGLQQRGSFTAGQEIGYLLPFAAPEEIVPLPFGVNAGDTFTVRGATSYRAPVRTNSVTGELWRDAVCSGTGNGTLRLQLAVSFQSPNGRRLIRRCWPPVTDANRARKTYCNLRKQPAGFLFTGPLQSVISCHSHSFTKADRESKQWER